MIQEIAAATDFKEVPTNTVCFRGRLVTVTWEVHLTIVSGTPPQNLNLNLVGCF